MGACRRGYASESSAFICLHYRYSLKEQIGNFTSGNYGRIYTERSGAEVASKDSTFVEQAGFAEFEWDEDKRASNWDKHNFDFEDVKQIFRCPHVRAPSIRRPEPRWMAVGLLEDVEITVVHTVQDERCRIISARRARHYERRAYHQAIHDRSTAGQN
ncbi:MAG: BrnT family toxin [Methylibium sp.]